MLRQAQHERSGLRADALHRRNLNAIREAEKTERAAFDALTRIRAPIGTADRK